MKLEKLSLEKFKALDSSTTKKIVGKGGFRTYNQPGATWVYSGGEQVLVGSSDDTQFDWIFHEE